MANWVAANRPKNTDNAFSVHYLFNTKWMNQGAFFHVQFYQSLPRVSKEKQSQALCGWFLSCYILSCENNSLTSGGRIQTYFGLSSVKKPLFSQSQPKYQHAWFTVKTKLTIRKSVCELFISHRQLIRSTVNSLLTDTSLNWRHVELIPAVTRHSDGHHSVISKADNGHYSSNSECKILIPLQRVMGNCANVFKLDKKVN